MKAVSFLPWRMMKALPAAASLPPLPVLSPVLRALAAVGLAPGIRAGIRARCEGRG